MTVKIISPKELDELAQKVDALLPKDLSFFRFGNRMVQIKRYLIENELDMTKTVAAIKRTAAWRKAWNADSIIASDVLDISHYINFIAADSNGNGMQTIFANFDIPSTVPFPALERVIENIIFAMDHILKDLEDIQKESNVEIPVKNYGKLMLNGAGFNLHFVKNAFPNYPKTIMETLFCHYPSFLSLSDIYISDDPNYVPPVHDGMYTLYLQNAPIFFKGLFTILRSFLPERWARQVCINTDMYIPLCMDRSLVPVQNGGTKEITSLQWLQHIAQEESCSLEKPTCHTVSSRIREQYGQGVNYKACEMPNSYARARMWKMTNVRSRWHHYYFVLTRENILYYFADAEATKILTGILLEGCSIENDTSEKAVEREGMDAINTGNAVTEGSKLIAGSVPEASGSSHRYHFILHTPSRPYVFACNTLEQKVAWMILLKRAIMNADKQTNSSYFCFTRILLFGLFLFSY